MKDKLEKAFQDALENYELPYNANAWNAVQKQLPKSKTPWYKIGGAAAIVLIAVILFAVYQNSTEKTALVQKDDFVDVKTPLNTADIQADATEIQTQNALPSNDKNTDAVQAKVNSIKKKKTDNAANADLNQTIFKSSINDPQPNSIDGPVQTPGEDRANEWLKEVQRVYIQGIENNYCINSDIFLRAMNLPKNTKLTWRLNNGKTFTGETLSVKASEDLKDVELDLNFVSDEYRRNNPVFGISHKLNVVQAAHANVVISKSERNTKTFVTLSNSNANIEHLVWKLDNITSTDLTCGKYLTTEGAHPYIVETYDNNGCFARIEGEIQVDKEYNLFVENTFTPNGDGINDNFLPEALKLRSVNFKMSIFDKNGKSIYTSTDRFAPWDGTLNGQPADSDTYIWTVSLINEEGLPEQYKGTIFLKR
jgi:gliding motility-associated-like protein